MIPKSGNRFSDKIMLKGNPELDPIQSNGIKLRARLIFAAANIFRRAKGAAAPLSRRTKVELMMRIAVPIAALAAMIGLYAPPSHAQIIGNAPWCAVVDTGAGRFESDCEYYSIQECRPNVIAGNRGFCQMNPRFRPGPRPLPPRRHYRHHHVPRY